VTPTRPSIGFARALLRYYRDPSASIFGKLIVFGAIAYAIMPVDLIPDVPIVGWLDDLGVMTLAMAWLTRVARRYQFVESVAPTLHP
jgi:uncharacterized membrane protein YkvA (DUF1232 family)